MKKLRLFSCLFATLAVIGCLTACTSKPNETSEKISVADMLGETIEINKNPKKVACVSRTTYDLLIAFGLGDYIDGAYKTIYDNPWVPEIYSGASREYKYEYEESYETFISRGVDLVFAPEKYISDGLKEHGVNALCVSLYGNPTFENYVYYMADLTKQLWDDPTVQAKADAWKNKVSKAISDVTTELAKHEIEEKTIYYVRGDKNKGIGYTDTKSSFTSYAYNALGFKFASDNFETNKPSAEAICEVNPDVIVIGGIYQNTLVNTLTTTEPYKNLDVVKNNKFYTIPVGFTMFEQIGIMTPVFFYDMANKIYPEYFNYDIEKMVKDTIKEYFDYDLTDSQVINMLQGKNSNGENLA